MKLLIAAVALTMMAPSVLLAQPAPEVPKPMDPNQELGLIACSYDSSGAYTGADSANPGEEAGGPVKQNDGGWRWVIRARDGRSCARRLPS